MADDAKIRERIGELEAQQRTLREQLEKGEITSAQERERLHEIEVEVDRSWDLLRRRDAARSAGKDPDEVEPRSQSTVENYLE
ncbi:DUF2630 domain-containing protein [Xylanimonas oleitrophica]|uniref:DUF2630 domain-containing protein n=1 Tax=Xylanimonas oleitrophica TaxID=2607479 RepID=A0A2W5Y581_9MICO|nr:DUF2630 family protein [Xylanimonas oleitrophica]PZR53204.1 DUF2630 domain-containing protein [Xylanimonas oleitrophica]